MSELSNLTIVTNNINLTKTLTKKINLNCKILNQKEFNKSKKQYDNLVIININLNDKINKIANKIFYINTNFEKDTIKNFMHIFNCINGTNLLSHHHIWVEIKNKTNK